MEAAHEVMSGNRMEIPQCASIFQKIMKTCWSHKREDRPEFKEILNWITEWETRQLFGNPDDPESVTYKEEDVYHIIDSKRLNYTDINKAKLIMDENRAKLAEEVSIKNFPAKILKFFRSQKVKKKKIQKFL